MKIYLAGPMRCVEYYNFPLFDSVTESLKEMGNLVINPAEMDRTMHGFDAMLLPKDFDWSVVPDGFDLNACIQHDIDCVLWADAVVLLPNWETSNGAKAEIAVARWAQKKVLLWPDMVQLEVF